jgi:hypothetical protein
LVGGVLREPEPTDPVSVGEEVRVPETLRGYRVYVIELDPAVLTEGRFRNANPGYRRGAPCVYVGSTGLTPEERYARHKSGVKANRYAQEFGFRLRPCLYTGRASFDTRLEAEAAERNLALRLRAAGYGVWTG